MCIEGWEADKGPTTARFWAVLAKRTRESLQEHWGRQNPGMLPKMALTHARTHKVQPSRQVTVNWLEKYGNRSIKAQDFEGLQGHWAIKRQTDHKAEKTKTYQQSTI